MSYKSIDEPIIKSMIDDDLYKITMANAAIKLFPDLKVEYEFFNRNNVKFPEGFDIELSKQVNRMKDLALTNDEKRFLSKKCGTYLAPPFLDFLYGYRYDPSEVMIMMDNNGKLDIKIKGYWYRTILWEVKLMAVISELYFKMTTSEENYPTKEKLESVTGSLSTKMAVELKSNNCEWSDMGTRRRFSYDNHDIAVKYLKLYGSPNFIGTSNMHLAMKHDVKCLGTVAHEFYMVNNALFGYRMGNHMANENWSNVYSGKLGTALTDTLTSESFFKTFTLKQARLFDGVRCDSGSPFQYVDMVVDFYKENNIDPLSKIAVFSDGLDTELAIKVHNYCKSKIQCKLGVGTFISNNLKSIGFTPLNMVIKLTRVFVDGVWVDTVKISDNKGKVMGPEDEVGLCKRTMGIINTDYDRVPAGNE